MIGRTGGFREPLVRRDQRRLNRGAALNVGAEIVGDAGSGDMRRSSPVQVATITVSDKRKTSALTRFEWRSRWHNPCEFRGRLASLL